MTRLFLTAAAFAALAASAQAQTTAPMGVAPAGPIDTSAFIEVEGTEIYSLGGERIGEIEEVLMNPQGEIVAITVEAGGFLGIGDREVVIDLGQLQREGDRFFVELTEEQIEALPEWDD